MLKPYRLIRQRTWLLVGAFMTLAACGGGGTATVYLSSIACTDGVALSSTASQAAADALVPASCPSISAAQQAAIDFAVSTAGSGVAKTIALNLSSLPAGALLAASTLTVTDGAGNSYSLAINPSPLSITATPALPFASNFTVSAGSLNFTNAPSVSLDGKTFTTPPSAALNDTGTTAAQCYEVGSDALVSCTSAGATALNAQQDGMIGRDVTANANADGKAGFSFALIANPAGGNFATTDCVKDQTTGLIWEGKTATGTRAGSNAYTHFDSTTALQFYVGYDPVSGNDILRAPTAAEVAASTNAAGYLAAVNAAALCGYSDWRLPTRSELQSVVDYGVAYPGPTIDAAWFPNTAGNWYWSSSPYAGLSDGAWGVSFSNGSVSNGHRDFAVYVRLVR